MLKQWNGGAFRNSGKNRIIEEGDRMAAGMKFPIQINPATGRFAESEGTENIRESVYMILMTQRGEHPIRKKTGSAILSYPFIDISPTRIHMLEREVRETLLRQEPRICDVEVHAAKEPGEDYLMVRVTYRVKETGEMESLELQVG